MRLTRRGKAVVGVCVAGFALAALSGARALNAVVLPGLVALAAGVIQLRYRPTPTVSRSARKVGAVGGTDEVTLSFSGVARPFVGVVSDRADDGLSAPDATVRAAVGGEPVTYEVTYESRGERELGPVEITTGDVFGLFETEMVLSETDRVLVYPRVRELGGAIRDELYALSAADAPESRTEFDRLREYVRGDATRDVHWKSTAKREELIVREFAPDAEVEAVHVAAGSTPDAADEMAEAAASVALALLDADVPVTLSLPDRRIEADPNRRGRTAVLEGCALASGGPVAGADADVVVRAEPGGTRVILGDRTATFADLRRGGSSRRPDRSTRRAPTGGSTA
ncbi:DUF58 domain-containing protein [Halegenticoccus soli]|uniref:DUF58 domain-containing protein n=1 Tax=Halegenticoccus soli TaxID=1985678 RepID=UPI000C6E7512|nr:DUF58 domain-containing protein [Halegenticoccus soli]